MKSWGIKYYIKCYIYIYILTVNNKSVERHLRA